MLIITDNALAITLPHGEMSLEDGVFDELLLTAFLVSDSGNCIGMDILHISGQLQMRLKHISNIKHPVDNGLGNNTQLVWLQVSSLGRKWSKAYIDITEMEGEIVQSILRVDRYIEEDGIIPIAIDNIQLINGDCATYLGE